MITTPTVFILGAGASKPYGFPSGAEIVRDICKAPESELDSFGVGQADYLEFATELRNSDQLSVDGFLELRPKFERVGKTAIAFHLVRCESVALLRPPDFRDWYSWLLNRMTASSFEGFKDNRVSFITFNYDRSLEHFLFSALCSRYGKSPEEVAAVLNGFQFVHVHGRLGRLPWQEPVTEYMREYDAATTSRAVIGASQGIKIISENIDDSAEFEQARRLMRGAKRIGILGFGYHHVNMRRLKIPIGTGLNIEVFGTSFGMSEAQRQHLAGLHPGLSLPLTNCKIMDLLCNTGAFLSD